MRRASAALLGTVAGTALLIGAKYDASPPTDAASTASGADGTASAGPAASGSASTDPSTSASAAASASAPAPTSAAAGSQPVATKPPAATTKPGGGATGGTAQPPPATTPAASCATATGAGATVVAPGEGSVVVTIKVCNGAITSASGTISKSNWEPQNTNAFKALNQLTVQYYKSDMSKITFSGATLTSNAYKTSLKSAMGKAGI